MIVLLLVALAAAPTPPPNPGPSQAGATASFVRTQEREALRKALLGVIDRSPLKNARISVQIRSLDDGSVVFAQNPDELLNPASNVKLFTAAGALARLGPDYRFDTEYLCDAESKDQMARDGKVKVLFMRGHGDPTLTTERLYQSVSDLMHAGVREVVGDIVVDDTWFDQEREPPGYDQEHGDRAYLAPPGALSLNWNAVGVYLRPGGGVGSPAVAELEPASEYFTLESRLFTGTATQRRFNVVSGLDKDKLHQKIEVTGYVPYEKGSWSVWKKIDSPALYTGFTLKRLLAERGIKVKGKVKLGTAPQNAKLVAVTQSDTLDIVLKRLNKHSSNFVAEQLIKTLGAEARGVPGTHPKGIDAIEEFLEREVGLKRGTYVMRNGSGLNDTNRFSAAQINSLLKYMWEHFPLAPEYLSSVGIAGKDGTLKYRFEGTDAVWRLRAKTGTLENVSALSGYVQAVSGERFVFSVIVNDFPGRASTVVGHIDAIGAAVASLGTSQGPVAAVAQLTPQSVIGPNDELLVRMKTFSEMGAKADRRNGSFLRTIWRSEKDPAVRAAIADALYQTDPRESASVRVLLDSVSAGDEVFGRLKRAARELKVGVPTVAPIIELAASGHPEALQRLLELVRAGASGDQALDDQLSDALASIANEAPNELLYAMRVAPVKDSEAAVDMLARGLVRAAQPEAALWETLKQSQGSLDPRAVDFAKQLEAQLSQKIAEARAPQMIDASTPAPVSAPQPAKKGGESATPGG